MASAAGSLAAERNDLFNRSGIPGHPSCAQTLGWHWFVLFLQLATLLHVAKMLSSAKGSWRIASLALLILVTSYLLPLCQTNLMLLHNSSAFPPELATGGASATAVAGTMVASIFNILLICLVGTHSWSSKGSSPADIDELRLEAHMAAKLATMKAEHAAAGSQPVTPTAGLLAGGHGRGSHLN
ncbi:hypothetical protein ABPG75_002547 [Micractinium tetrahymenae]